MRRQRAIWSDDQAAAIILAGVGLFFFGYFLMFAALLADSDFEAITGGATESNGTVTLISGLLSLFAFGGSVYVLGIRRHVLRWRAVSFRPTSLTWLMVSLLIGLFFVPVSLTLSLVIQNTFLGESSILEIPPPEFDVVPLGEFALTFLSVAVIVPIAEEMFFRGLLFRWIRTRTNLKTGLVLSSIIFGAVHLSPVSLLSLSIVGGFCALMLEYSGSLWNAIAIHAANNGILVIVSYFVFKSSLVF